jgi:hypothetical protein
LEPVELGDQGEEAVLGGVDVSGERGDLIAQVLERVEVVVGRGIVWIRRRVVEVGL